MFQRLAHWRWCRRGAGLLGQERWGEAVSAFRRALDANPESSTAHRNLAGALYKLGMHAEAAAHYRKAVALDPTDEVSLMNLGGSLMLQGLWQESAEAYRRRLALTPHDADTHLNLGVVLVLGEQWQEAASVFEAGLALDPAWADDGDIGFSLDDLGCFGGTPTPRDVHISWYCSQFAEALIHLERFDRAATILRKAVTLRPDQAALYRLLGPVSLRLGRHEEGAEALRRAIDLGVPGIDYVQYGDALLASGSSEAAVSAYVGALIRDPGNLEQYHRLGDLLEREQRWDDARAVYQEAQRAGLGAQDTSNRLMSLPQGEPTHVEPRPRRQRDTSVSDVPILFVVSEDFGELSNASLILQDQGFHQATILLPQRLFELNAEPLPGSVLSYGSLDDVLRVVHRTEPRIVFLLSGYLFSMESALDADALVLLVDELRGLGCHVVTSDPFLGLMSDPATAESWTQMHGSHMQNGEALRDLVHFYPFLSEPFAQSVDLDCTSTFNAALLHEGDDASHATTLRLVDEIGVSTDAPFALFLINTEDFKLQTGIRPEGEFIDLLAARLREAADAEGQSAIIGPKECIARLRPVLDPDDPSIVLIDFCENRVFKWLVRSAACVFYWNIFSNSIFTRIPLGRRTFFFHPGHLAIHPPLRSRGVLNYFHGWDPICLDMALPRSESAMAIVEHFSRKHLQRLGDHLWSTSAPTEMVADLLHTP